MSIAMCGGSAIKGEEAKVQAFRASTVIDSKGELHLGKVPFHPGSSVEVIVLEQSLDLDGRESVSQARTHDGVEDGRSAERTASADWPNAELVEEQYRLAREYPDEYVVLVKKQVIHHSPDRERALSAYDQAFLDHPSDYPVIVEPGDTPKKPPVFRGRSMTKASAK